MRRLILRLFIALGGLRIWRFLKRKHIIIVYLHGVMDEDVPTEWVPLRGQCPRSALDTALRLLKRHYNFVSLDEALAMLRGDMPLRHYSMVLTFDDGYLNNLRHALPILKKHEVPGVMYIASGHVEERKPFWFDRLDYAIRHADVEGMEFSINGRTLSLDSSSEAALKSSFKKLRDTAKQGDRCDLEMLEELDSMSERLERRSGRRLSDIFETDDWSSVMTWQQIDELVDEPLVEVGSHTVNHIRLGKVGRDIVMRELLESKSMIEEKTTTTCRHFCYPDGSTNAATPEFVAEAGYISAVTTETGTNPASSDPMRLKRIHLPESDDAMRILLAASGFADALAKLRRS